MRTIEFNVGYIKSIFTTIESRGFDQADFVENRVDPGDTGSTLFVLIIFKLEIFREDIPHAQFQNQQTNLFVTHACPSLLHITQIKHCGMQCTS